MLESWAVFEPCDDRRFFQQEPAVADLQTILPDDLYARLERHLSSTQQDKARFIASAVDEKLARSDEEALSERVTESIDASLRDIEAGRVVDAREGMCQIAEECGIKFDR